MARIVQLVCSDGYAGVERHVVSLSTGLAARGHEVTMIGGDHQRVPRELGTAVDWLPADTVRAGVGALRRLRRADIVHAHMSEAELAAVLAYPAHRAPVVSTRHFARTRGSSRLARTVGAGIRHRLAAQISVSQWVADRIGEPSTVVHSGVASVAAPAGARTDVVLVVSRLEAEKRVDLALSAWQASGLAAHGWRLEIAGDGALRPALVAQARELGVEPSVRFLGARDDVPALLDSAAIMLAPCPVEAFGLALVEAMSHELPVVAVRQGAHAELLSDVAGAALFDVADPAQAGALLARLAADPQRRSDYGERLQQTQRERFSLAGQVDGTLAVYEEIW